MNSRPEHTPADNPIDRILVDKSQRRLFAYRNGELIREIRVALGRGGLAPKRRQGDGRRNEATRWLCRQAVRGGQA